MAAVIAERERAEREQGRLVREQAALEARHALAALNRKLIDAQEQERTWIARELHDNISQRLALVIYELSARPEAEAGELQALVSEIAADVHALSHNLHSPKLELLGLATGMRVLCREFSEQQNARVSLEADDVPQVPPETALCLYRILQEALHNVDKHSGVGDVDVRLWGSGDEIHLRVSDRGVGFDLESTRRSPGIGLVNMQERIKLVGGDLSIESAPQRGTTIHARVPLQASELSDSELNDVQTAPARLK
jgi:signal transduction histidine kinase